MIRDNLQEESNMSSGRARRHVSELQKQFPSERFEENSEYIPVALRNDKTVLELIQVNVT